MEFCPESGACGKPVSSSNARAVFNQGGLGLAGSPHAGGTGRWVSAEARSPPWPHTPQGLARDLFGLCLYEVALQVEGDCVVPPGPQQTRDLRCPQLGPLGPSAPASPVG